MAMDKVESSRSALVKTKQINVTDLTSCQKRRVFVNCLTEGGFVAFDKKSVGGQTYYVFIYKN